MHPLEGDQGPYQDCSRCVCCIRTGLGVKILGSQPVKPTSSVKMLLEYVVFITDMHAYYLQNTVGLLSP